MVHLFNFKYPSPPKNFKLLYVYWTKNYLCTFNYMLHLTDTKSNKTVPFVTAHVLENFEPAENNVEAILFRGKNK